MRKRNYSIYEISEALQERTLPLSPTAVREVLKAEGFAALPRRLDEERPARPHPTVEPVADARAVSLVPRRFQTRCGGLFLFVPEFVRLHVTELAEAARLPGSKMIPAPHALRAALALKLWSIEHKHHIMALVADEGLALFAGLSAIPKKSYLAEYSSRIDHAMTLKLLAAWHRDLIDMPATVEVTTTGITVQFHRRAHLPIVIASGRLNKPVKVPWWNDMPLRLTT